MDKDRKEIYHILPTGDTYKHSESVNCSCNPVCGYNKEGKFLVVHNAFDGRDLLEQAKRQIENNTN